jgi:hypothetical protein
LLDDAVAAVELDVLAWSARAVPTPCCRAAAAVDAVSPCAPSSVANEAGSLVINSSANLLPMSMDGLTMIPMNGWTRENKLNSQDWSLDAPYPVPLLTPKPVNSNLTGLD